MAYAIYAGIFVLLLAAVALVAWGTKPTGRNAKVHAALDHLDTYDSRAFRRAELAQPASQRLLKPALARLGAASKVITPTGRIRKLEVKVERAGRPWKLDVN